MSDKAARFDSRALHEKLLAYPRAGRYIVGFSGGADSTALLAALHALRPRLEASVEAVHFNHGLQRDSDSWQRHCERFCGERGIPLSCQALEIQAAGGNLEARAREQRYRHIEQHIDAGSIYLTAHNADDRAETFLLHALRGSGLEGLASIPEFRALGRGDLARPLLDFSRRSLTAYLRDQGLEWIEDPSNRDSDMDRNFVRQEIIPLLESRWPAARTTLARTARHLAAASAVLQDLVTREARLDAYQELRLPLEVLHRLGDPASGLVLRAWLRAAGAPALPEPRLVELLGQLASAAAGAQCETAWAGWTLKRFRDELRLVPPGDLPECPERVWDTTPVLALGSGLGVLRIRGAGGAAPRDWAVGPRRPGRRIQLHAGGPRRKLKKVFQEQRIPHWQRRSIPVLYWGDQAVAIGDWSISPQLEAWLGEHGLAYRWEPDHPELRRSRIDCHEYLARRRPA